jgi:3-ketosteroid 9alpha-monooxygenase subunit A
MATSAEYKLGEFPFPRGWFAVAKSSEIGRRPMSVHYFGQDMVIYRGASGRAVILDAFCPHMGTHLGSAPNSATSISETYMEEDNIRCPFHAWRFGADGVCNHIPYSDAAIPPQARVKSWRIEERYGIVFTWHDPEQQAPDFAIAAFPEWDDPTYIRWESIEYLCDLYHPIEIFDNMSDPAHLNHLHGTKVISYENEVDGIILYQREAALAPQGDSTIGDRLTTIAGYAGPGIAFGRFTELQAAQIICATPIDDGTCRLWQAVMVKPRAGMTGDVAKHYRDGLSKKLGDGLLRDAEVWAAKKPALNIMQMPGDGPFRQSRVWYSQFFNPRAQAAEIVGRVNGKHYAKGIPGFTSEVNLGGYLGG